MERQQLSARKQKSAFGYWWLPFVMIEGLFVALVALRPRKHSPSTRQN